VASTVLGFFGETQMLSAASLLVLEIGLSSRQEIAVVEQ
jgi:hypothetical protein